MSHELEENVERRKRIVAKIRQHPKGADLTTLTRLIMDMGYNLRGARDKIKELEYGHWIKEHDLHWFAFDAVARKREEESEMVTKGSEQGEN